MKRLGEGLRKLVKLRRLLAMPLQQHGRLLVSIEKLRDGPI